MLVASSSDIVLGYKQWALQFPQKAVLFPYAQGTWTFLSNLSQWWVFSCMIIGGGRDGNCWSPVLLPFHISIILKTPCLDTEANLKTSNGKSSLLMGSFWVELHGKPREAAVPWKEDCVISGKKDSEISHRQIKANAADIKPKNFPFSFWGK